MNTVATYKDAVAGILQGTNLNNVTNLNGAIARAARTMCQRADIPAATGREIITLYSMVYDYLAPTTIFGGAVNDLRPLGVSRNQNDFVYKQPIELFDRTKAILPNGTSLTFEWIAGVGLVRVSNPKTPQGIIIDSMNVTTGWIAAGTASDLIADSSFFYKAPASLRFTLTGAGSGTFTKTVTSMDLTSYRGVGVVFVAMETPDVTSLTNLKIRLGSDASNYYEVTATQAFLGAFKTGDFQLVAFDLATATTVGSPVITAVDYFQVIVAHTATITNMRLGSAFISLPSPHEILFQSNAIFSHNGVLSTTITDDSDLIILNDAAYTIFEYEGADAVAMQSGGRLAGGVLALISQKLHGIKGVQLGLYDQFRADNPSQELREVGSWY